ncbi:MAG: dTDP-4-dehydrorhamnose 3,5-epimerase, partial [Actinobacteria bacterium]|nr:dTDP-4-dehydrorhamnose 3,5-epimerase [Actinomycetota bacterium]
SRRGVLRGLHFQRDPGAQAKLVAVPRGRMFDVAVDIRPGSPTFGRWVGQELDGESGRMLFVPEGFAHGYAVLSDEADVLYRATAEYAPELEGGIRWDDPDLGIEWPVADPVVSARDRALPLLRDLEGDGDEGVTVRHERPERHERAAVGGSVRRSN